MAKFEDKHSHTWNVNLDVGMLEDIQEATGVNLDELMIEPNKMSKFVFLTPRKFVEVMWVVCKEQAETHKLDARGFGRLFDRDTLDLATNAFIEAIFSFYPRSSVAAVLRGKMPQLIEEMDSSLVKEAEKRVTQALSDMRTGLQESSESIPVPTG